MPRAGVTRDAILDAAGEIAEADGPAAITLADIARRLGVKPPSLYKHVDGLDDVLDGLALRGLREANRRLTTATVGKARTEALFALAHAYWRFARERPGLYAASVALRSDAPGIAAASDSLVGTVLAVLSGYGVTGDDALHATRGFRAIIHGFVSLDAAGGFRLKLDVEESLNRLISAFASDLAARAG